MSYKTSMGVVDSWHQHPLVLFGGCALATLAVLKLMQRRLPTAAAHNPVPGPLMAVGPGLPPSDIPGMPVEIDYDIAMQMMNWHTGQGDPVYAAASSALAGRKVPAEVAEEAVYWLQRDYAKGIANREDRDELAGILDYFMMEHGIEG